MKIKMGLLVAAVGIAVAAFFVRQKGAESTVSTDPVASPSPKSATVVGLPASSVLKIDPRAKSPTAAPMAINAKPVSADMQQYRDRKDFSALYDRLKEGAQTPEAQYLQAEILDRCTKRAPDPNKPEETREVKREKFISGLSGGADKIVIRTAAYDELNRDICGKLGTIPQNKEEIAALRKAAAEAGDPRARAWQLNSDILKATDEAQAANAGKPGSNEPGARGQGYVLNDQQWSTIRELLGSGDPGVVGELRAVMSSTLVEASLRIGPDKEPIDNRAFWNTWALVACDLGADCGSNSRQLLADCMSQNRCGSNNVYDHSYFYDASPNDAQSMERYRQQLLEMIRTNNFANLQLVRGPQSNRGTFVFRNR
jgi:6-pyruvoyl-tetrahydropterin synthase